MSTYIPTEIHISLEERVEELEEKYADLKKSIVEFMEGLPAALSLEIETRMQHVHTIAVGQYGHELPSGPARKPE